jgi:hypothetical protein
LATDHAAARAGFAIIVDMATARFDEAQEEVEPGRPRE